MWKEGKWDVSRNSTNMIINKCMHGSLFEYSDNLSSVYYIPSNGDRIKNFFKGCEWHFFLNIYVIHMGVIKRWHILILGISSKTRFLVRFRARHFYKKILLAYYWKIKFGLKSAYQEHFNVDFNQICMKFMY